MFPSWESVQRNREVVLFVVGLMKDSRPLVQHVYEMLAEFYLNQIRTGFSNLILLDDLLKSLHKESTVRMFDHPLHNKYINYYGHWKDEEMKRPFDTTPVYYPSRLYHFELMKEDVILIKHKEERAEVPECAMYIHEPKIILTNSLLSKCRKISEHQAVTDLRIQYVECGGMTEAELPIFSRKMQFLCITHA